MADPKHEKYNKSLKGQLRNKRYEAKHPERRGRFRNGFIVRDALRPAHEEKSAEE